jgi:hypothetical protein
MTSDVALSTATLERAADYERCQVLRRAAEILEGEAGLLADKRECRKAAALLRAIADS